MKRIVIVTLAAGAVTAGGVFLGMDPAESEHRGNWRGGEQGAGYGAGGHGWGKRGGGHMGRHHGRGHRMKRMMHRFDTDKDGKLTQAEIDGSRKALVAKHDANADGQLTLAEFQNLWLEVRRRRMVRSFQRIDEDGDAAITLAEFLEPFSRIVERMDRNEDGVLDKQDRRRRHGMRRRAPETESEGDNAQQQ